MRIHSTAGLVVLLAAALGCGGGEQKESAQDPAAGEARPKAEEPQGAGRDLSAVNVCELIPADAVAKAMGGAPGGPPEAHDPGFDGKGCRYAVRAGSRTRYAEVGLLPPEEYEFRRRMRSGEPHDLTGLGDGAWWQHRTDRTDVNVLKANDVGLWIRFQENAAATREEEARRLGEAVLASLDR